MKIMANISPKKHGVRLEDDLDSCNLEKLQNHTLTLRRVMGIVCSVYDLLGLISPITLKLKILLKETHKIPKLKWDDDLPREMQLRWVEAIKDIVNMQEIRIPRFVKPEETKNKLELIGYWDGADPAFAV